MALLVAASLWWVEDFWENKARRGVGSPIKPITEVVIGWLGPWESQNSVCCPDFAVIHVSAWTGDSNWDMAEGAESFLHLPDGYLGQMISTAPLLSNTERHHKPKIMKDYCFNFSTKFPPKRPFSTFFSKVGKVLSRSSWSHRLNHSTPRPSPGEIMSPMETILTMWSIAAQPPCIWITNRSSGPESLRKGRARSSCKRAGICSI